MFRRYRHVHSRRRLLAQPGPEVHAIDLEGGLGKRAPDPSDPGRRSGSAELEARRGLDDAGVLLEAEAKAA